jgi:heme O synthase-like polyprenyltransferase
VRVVREGARAERVAMQMFTFSIFYLFVLFAVLLIESGLGLIGRAAA